jgi:ubiquinone/menaquinone biosynthesis C-methylase UbiE
MSDSISDEQARIYFERAREYDALIAAEDADGNVVKHLASRLPLDGARLADVGAGTGRLACLLGSRVSQVHLSDRAGPMLEVARDKLQKAGLADKATFEVADARELRLADASVDVAAAGWVFGHFRHWMPDGWRHEVDAALAQMERVVVPGGHVVILETLGTGHETPRTHEGLDEYFAHLESAHGFERTWFRTDYVFADADTAARVLGEFFGDALVAKIRAASWSRVPECTGLWIKRKPA